MERPSVTLVELQTVYGLEDLYDLLEVAAVNAENARIDAERQRQRRRR